MTVLCKLIAVVVCRCANTVLYCLYPICSYF